VTACGHTFCIGEWTADDQQRNCPICRNRISFFGPPRRHFQMDNFVEKMYAFPSGLAASNRAALIADRAQLAAARSAPASVTADTARASLTTTSPSFSFAAIAAESGPPPSTPPSAATGEPGFLLAKSWNSTDGGKRSLPSVDGGHCISTAEGSLHPARRAGRLDLGDVHPDHFHQSADHGGSVIRGRNSIRRVS
jgi:hypothetical protein